MTDAYRRCLREQAFIRSYGHGPFPGNSLSAIGDADWEAEMYFTYKGDEKMEMNEYRDECHKAHVKWWLDLDRPCPSCTEGTRMGDVILTCTLCMDHRYAMKTRDDGEMLFLAVSELAESMEGHRKSKPGHPVMDDHLPHRVMAEVELADFLIRMFDTAGGRDWDLNDGEFIFANLNNAGEIVANEIGSGPCEVLRARTYGRRLLEITGTLEAIVGAYGRPDKTYRALHAIKLCLLLAYDSGFDIDGAYREKLAYNAHRADHKIEARLAPGGKSY